MLPTSRGLPSKARKSFSKISIPPNAAAIAARFSRKSPLIETVAIEAEMVEALAGEGYRIVLVADGLVKSFANILGGHGVSAHFEAEIISEAQGCEKPAAQMFLAALSALGIDPAEAAATVVGNHLGRDVKDANELEFISIWQN
jgi:FMN phosphatase YigB (HAD superfamily)